jgi:hypothetical protein
MDSFWPPTLSFFIETLNFSTNFGKNYGNFYVANLDIVPPSIIQLMTKIKLSIVPFSMFSALSSTTKNIGTPTFILYNMIITKQCMLPLVIIYLKFYMGSNLSPL